MHRLHETRRTRQLLLASPSLDAEPLAAPCRVDSGRSGCGQRKKIELEDWSREGDVYTSHGLRNSGLTECA
jgi:hypothetical protein